MLAPREGAVGRDGFDMNLRRGKGAVALYGDDVPGSYLNRWSPVLELGQQQPCATFVQSWLNTGTRYRLRIKAFHARAFCSSRPTLQSLARSLSDSPARRQLFELPGRLLLPCSDRSSRAPVQTRIAAQTPTTPHCATPYLPCVSSCFVSRPLHTSVLLITHVHLGLLARHQSPTST
jgi:hypothetical protein